MLQIDNQAGQRILGQGIKFLQPRDHLHVFPHLCAVDDKKRTVNWIGLLLRYNGLLMTDPNGRQFVLCPNPSRCQSDQSDRRRRLHYLTFVRPTADATDGFGIWDSTKKRQNEGGHFIHDLDTSICTLRYIDM